jgi:hypothetical protein
MTTHEYDDFAAIGADDALLDALGADDIDLTDPDLTASDDDLADLLAGWRRELDTAVAALPARGTAVVVPVAHAVAAGDASSDADSAGRAGWLRRHIAPVAAAAAIVVAGSTGVAAAPGRGSGPLAAVHRVVWGAPAPDDSALLARVTTLLDGVTIDLEDARAHGGATAARISDMSDRLDHAGRLLAGDPAAPDAQTARLVELRADLAALDTVPTSPPAVGTANGGQTARFPGETGSRGSGKESSADGTNDGNDSGPSADDAGQGGHRDEAVNRDDPATSGTNRGGTDGGSGPDGGGSNSGPDGSLSGGGGPDSGSGGSGSGGTGSGGTGSGGTGSGGSGSGGSGSGG